MSTVSVIGSFPPPFNGQNILVRRGAALLQRHFEVNTVDTSTGESVLNDELSVVRRIRHYAHLRGVIKTGLASAPDSPVVWHTVSPQPLGHLRDLLTVLPSVPKTAALWAVIHWGNFDRLFTQAATRATAPHLVRRVRGFVFNDISLADRCVRYVPDHKRFVIVNSIEEAMIPDVSAIQRKLATGIGDRAVETAQTDSREPDPAILFVANMIPTKGYMELLRALPILLDRGVAFRAVFVGAWQSDVHRSRFEADVRGLNLADRVTHHGSIGNRETLAKIFRDARVFALPTYYPTEAQPVAVIEALASGTPVVVSRHASLPNMVRDGQEARFVDPHNPADIADAIEQLLQPTTWQTAAAAARQRFDEKYAPDVVAEQWRTLLERS